MPWTGTRIVPGLRADHDNAIDHWDVAPRLNVRQDLTGSYPKITLKGGAGLYYQPPSPLDTAPGLGQPGLTSNRSTHYDVGYEQEFSRHLELSTDLFYKRFDRLVTPLARNAGSGSAYGVEWLLRYKADPNFFGWVAYTSLTPMLFNEGGANPMPPVCADHFTSTLPDFRRRSACLQASSRPASQSWLYRANALAVSCGAPIPRS